MQLLLRGEAKPWTVGWVGRKETRMKVGCNMQVLSVTAANRHWLELLYASLALLTKAQRPSRD